ncbi:hypothetical protein [Paraferrimonas sp. SM1919]|uniref:hypothetical protein n=1 Tax=Paraferrimonas sp. SM1919 TaxID=2662263 RepID=UPI0013D79ACA|nr:hypothetical protein [Paraferrimonas sp. SM1919]
MNEYTIKKLDKSTLIMQILTLIGVTISLYLSINIVITEADGTDIIIFTYKDYWFTYIPLLACSIYGLISIQEKYKNPITHPTLKHFPKHPHPIITITTIIAVYATVPLAIDIFSENLSLFTLLYIAGFIIFHGIVFTYNRHINLKKYLKININIDDIKYLILHLAVRMDRTPKLIIVNLLSNKLYDEEWESETMLYDILTHEHLTSILLKGDIQKALSIADKYLNHSILTEQSYNNFACTITFGQTENYEVLQRPSFVRLENLKDKSSTDYSLISAFNYFYGTTVKKDRKMALNLLSVAAKKHLLAVLEFICLNQDKLPNLNFSELIINNISACDNVCLMYIIDSVAYRQNDVNLQRNVIKAYITHHSTLAYTKALSEEPNLRLEQYLEAQNLNLLHDVFSAITGEPHHNTYNAVKAFEEQSKNILNLARKSAFKPRIKVSNDGLTKQNLTQINAYYGTETQD